MKKYFDKGLANISSKAVTTASSLFGQHREDASLTSVDVSRLTPQEAVLQLQNHNSALIARVRQLQGASAENEAYQKQIADQQSRIRELTAESARKGEIYRATQTKHKESLERLQVERDNLAAQAKQSQAEAGKNQALKVDLEEARARLLLNCSESAAVPAGSEAEWQSLKAKLQEQLQSLKQQAGVSTYSAASGADEAAARLAEVEAALQESQRCAHELSKRCGEMQEEIDVLQRQRAAALNAAAGAAAAADAQLAQAAAEELPALEGSSSMQAESDPAGQVGPRAGAPADGWGFDDDEWDEWGEETKSAAVIAPGTSLEQGVSADANTAEATTTSDASDAVPEPTVHGLADSGVPDAICRSEHPEPTGPAPLEDLNQDSMPVYAHSMLGADSESAHERRQQLDGRPQVDTWDARQRSPSLGPVDLVTDTPSGSPAGQASPADMGVRQLVSQLTPPPQAGCVTAPSSLSTIARSAFHATPLSDVKAQDAGAGSNAQEDDSPAALSFNPLFDASIPTPAHPGEEASADKPDKMLASTDAPHALLATPLLQWEALKPRQLSEHLRVLRSVSVALERAQVHGVSDVPDTAITQPPAPVERLSLQALCEAVHTVEQELVGHITDIRACFAAAALPRKLSGLGSETLLCLSSQPGAIGTPHSPGGSPAASASIFGLHSTLQELLRAHQGLLDSCSGGDATAQQCCADTKRLAAEVEAELQRLQELHLQQETEVAIQWREKQQVQSTAQVQMSAKEQELVLYQQQAEMYQAQLADLDAAYEQLMTECQDLRVAAQRSAGLSWEAQLLVHRSRQTASSHGIDTLAEAPMHSTQAVSDFATAAAAEVAEDVIQLDSVPAVAQSPAANVSQGLEGLEQAAAEASEIAEGACSGRMALLEERAAGLEGQLKAVMSERDMMLAGIGHIEQATASRLEKAEQLKQELQTARDSAAAAAADAEVLRQAGHEQAAEIATLRGMIKEQQEVLEAGRQGALQLENKVSELEAALQAAEAQARASVDGKADAGSADELATRLEAAQQLLGVLTGQLDQSKQAMAILKAEHRAALQAASEQEEEMQAHVADAEAAQLVLQEEHALGIARLQEELAGRTEDVRAEARDLVKKGTADLQQALRGAQAQLQVARSENTSLQEEHAKELSDAHAKAADNEYQLRSAQEQIRELQAAAEGNSSTAKREIGRLQSEVEALQARVERMQKLSKDKKAELETLQAQHSSTRQAQQAAETRADKALRELAAVTARAGASTEKLQQAEAQCKELAAVRAKVEKAPSSTPDAPLMQQVDALCAAAQQAAKLLQEATTLRTSADEGAMLRGKVTKLSSAAAESAAATQLLQGELAQAISDLAASRDELQVCKGELGRVQKQAKKDRVHFETEMSKRGSYLGSLPQGNLAAWPEAVQSLVQAKVDAAVAQAREVLQAEAMTALEQADAERNVLQQELQQATGRATELETGSRQSEGKAQLLQAELREQEAALQEQISALQLRLEHATAAYTHVQSSDESMKHKLRDMEAHREELRAEVVSLRRKVEEARMGGWAGRRKGEHGANGGHVPRASDDSLAEYAVQKLPKELELAGESQAELRWAGTKPPHIASDPDTEGLVDYWKQMYSEASVRLQEVQKEVSLVQMELDDERHVHELRSLADGARKLEIQELQAVQGRADLNVEYLKNVLLGFFESEELPLNKQVLIVLDRLLLFTPQDRARIWKTEAKSHKPGWVSSLFK